MCMRILDRRDDVPLGNDRSGALPGLVGRTLPPGPAVP